MILPTGVIAHRGASAFAPENTMAAFKMARDMGARWIETDVMLTQDGVAIVHHDDNLARTTGLNALVAQTDYETIQTLDAGSWFRSTFINERIPTLEETLFWARETKMKFNLEIKPTLGQDRETALVMMTMLKEHLVSIDDVLISSFSLTALEVAQAYAPEYSYGWLADNLNDLQVGLQSGLNFATINLNERYLTLYMLADLQARGYAVLVYTANDPIRAEYFLSQGVKAIFSDNPKLLK